MVAYTAHDIVDGEGPMNKARDVVAHAGNGQWGSGDTFEGVFQMYSLLLLLCASGAAVMMRMVMIIGIIIITLIAMLLPPAVAATAVVARGARSAGAMVVAVTMMMVVTSAVVMFRWPIRRRFSRRQGAQSVDVLVTEVKLDHVLGGLVVEVGCYALKIFA